MKIIFLFIAGAFAAQDTTPPVISLSFMKHPTTNINSGYDGGYGGSAGHCRTHMQWKASAEQSAADSSKSWDIAYNACAGITGKGLEASVQENCEATTASKCHWVAPGDEVPKWYFEIGQEHRHGHADVKKRASVTCIVGGTETTCPDPSCTAADHHDSGAGCDLPHVVMVRKNAADVATAEIFDKSPYDTTAIGYASMTQTQAYALESANSYAAGDDTLFPRNALATYGTIPKTREASPNSARWTSTNRNNAQLPSNECTPSASKTCVDRNLLGQYLVTYTASDESGNQAEPVAFSFLFVDPFVPEIVFTAGTNSKYTDSTGTQVERNELGQTSNMYGYPTATELTGTSAGDSIFPGVEGSYGCGDECKETDLPLLDPKTFGALYSPISGAEKKTQTDHRDDVKDVFTGDVFDQNGAANAANALSLSSDGAGSHLNFNQGTHAPAYAADVDFEAGRVGRYGGFFCPMEHVEQDPDKDTGFCLRKVLDPVATAACAALGKVACDGNAECQWHAKPLRTTTKVATFPYDVAATAKDNYRANNKMQVYYQWYEDGSAEGTWKNAASTVDVIMKPGKEVQISWFVDDKAGDFGFNQMSNPQTHTILFKVTDNTRPILMAGKKRWNTAADPEGMFSPNYSKATFAIDPREQTKAQLAALGYQAVTCTDLNSEDLCKGTCDWNADSGCTLKSGQTKFQHCATRIAAGDAGHETTCSSQTSAKDCWDESTDCFWTSSSMFKDLDWKDGTGQTCTGGAIYKYKVVDGCTKSTDSSGVKNAKCTGSVTFEGLKEQAKIKYTTYEKCRPTSNKPRVDATTTQYLNEYTVVAECGYQRDDTSNAVRVEPDGTVLSWDHTEYGVRVYDNWDNIVEGTAPIPNPNALKPTLYQEIELFTNVNGLTDVTTDDTTKAPSISDAILATAGIDTLDDSKQGYGALDNTQLFQTTANSAGHSASAWNLRGLYYRSGLVTDAETDFYNDFWVVYRYTDSNGNSARPLLRKIVTRDTTPPSIELVGDTTLENSAGSYVHTTDQSGATNQAECVTKANRTMACQPAAANANACNAMSDCIWSYADADAYQSSGNGLFDQDRIIRYFKHRDDCDKDLITTVTLHDGLNCATNQKVACKHADDNDDDDSHACFAGVFQYDAVDGDWQQPLLSATNLLDTSGDRHQVFPEWTAGSYSIKYQAEDAAGLTNTVCREILNVDHTFPIIQILGSDQMTLEATHQGNYIDDGATCSDQVDGVISQNVEVSGDVVNLSKVGTYTITYNCKDSANNAAPAARRTVVVAQTSCPRCHVYGAHTVNHEASFPYADPGARCSDVIDGSTPTQCYHSAVDSDVIATEVPCTSENMVDVSTTGTYKIEYKAQNTVGLWNTASNCRGGQKIYRRTVVVMDTLRPVITLKYDKGTGTASTVAQGTVGNHKGGIDGTGQGYNGETTQSGYTALTNNDKAAPYPSLAAKGKTSVAQGYFNPTSVGGTLDGYATAFCKGVTPATDAACTGLGKTACDNDDTQCIWHTIPQGDPRGRWMAEESTSSVNGWVVGAIASAVAGLALLGYSTRRTAVATSVPV